MSGYRDWQLLRDLLREHVEPLPPLFRCSVEAELAQAEGRWADAIAAWQRVPDQGLLEQALLHSLLGRHDEELKNADATREQTPESRDAINGPYVSFVRSVVLVRAGRIAEGEAEVRRLCAAAARPQGGGSRQPWHRRSPTRRDSRGLRRGRSSPLSTREATGDGCKS